MINKEKTISVYKPQYRKVGVDNFGKPQWVVTMGVVGTASSYEDAKKKFGVGAIVDGYARHPFDY